MFNRYSSSVYLQLSAHHVIEFCHRRLRILSEQSCSFSKSRLLHRYQAFPIANIPSYQPQKHLLLDLERGALSRKRKIRKFGRTPQNICQTKIQRSHQGTGTRKCKMRDEVIRVDSMDHAMGKIGQHMCSARSSGTRVG
jgi:hypothetical protein